jgi:hypothetical protein
MVVYILCVKLFIFLSKNRGVIARSKTKFLAILSLELFADGENLKKFWESSRLLMNFMLSFIFGFGLTRLHEALTLTPTHPNFIPLDLFKLIIAYITVFQAWISYNWVNYIKKEYSNENALIFFLDILSTIIYWGLLHSYDRLLVYSLLLFVALHVIYVLWALIRLAYNNSSFCRRRVCLNLFFLVIFVVTAFVNQYIYSNHDLLYCIIVLTLMIFYRIIKLFPYFTDKSL